MAKQTVPPLPLPKHWPQKVRSAAVHAIALARLALTTARGQANSADPGSGRIARLTMVVDPERTGGLVTRKRLDLADIGAH
jgi:hypothetical protein